MKIVFTGGGTGGHFYPIIAVAEAIHEIAAERHLIEPQLYYIAPKPFDEQALFENNIRFVPCPAGRVRRYFSIKNFTDVFVTLTGIVRAFFALLRLYPDVVFSKGGFASVPAIIAAHWLRIPIVIHESDSKPGRATLIGARYADKIAITFESSIQYFPMRSREKIARTGIPIRRALASTLPEGAAQELGLDPSAPTILILGGSSGSIRINELVLTALPDLVSFANIIHQTGKDNFSSVEKTASVILEGNPHKSRYHVFPYLTRDSLREAAGAADLVVSRAGATSIAEIALWHKPAILIPIPESISHDQRTNAYAYAHSGAAIVLEEENMTPHLLYSEARRILSDANLTAGMVAKSEAFATTGSARLIAEELMRIVFSHDSKENPYSQPPV